MRNWNSSKTLTQVHIVSFQTTYEELKLRLWENNSIAIRFQTTYEELKLEVHFHPPWWSGFQTTYEELKPALLAL